MKMHLAWIRVTAAAATTIATFGGQMAVGQGQYGPYAPASTVNPYTSVAPYGVQPTPPAQTTTYYPSTVYPTTPNTTQAPATATPTTTTATAGGRYTPAQQPVYRTAQQPVAAQPQVTTQQPVYRTAQQPSYIPATQQPYSPAVQATQPQMQQPAAAIQAPQYMSGPYLASQYQATPSSQASQYEAARYQQPPTYPTYTAMADTSHAGPTPTSTPVVPPQSVEPLPTPDPAISGDAMPQGYNAISNQGNTEGLDGYYASDPGCNNGSCDYNACGAEPCVENCDAGCRWFCGVYGLYMTRDGGGQFQRLTVDVDENSTTYPYYPPADVTVLTNDVDYGWVPGYEVRFGALFDVGGSTCAPACDTGCTTGCGDCNTGCGSYCPPQTYAWEAGFWWLEDDNQWSVVQDDMPGDNMRLYGMKNFAGLQYDHDRDGANWRPLNDYYDYQMPVNAPTPPVAGDIRVTAQRVRTNWSAQNIELNLLRLPMFCGGTCGGYDACGGNGDCGSCTSPFTLVGLCGFRYLRFDDAFEYGTWCSEYDGAGWQTPYALYYDINVDNHLMGFQLGANMNYCVGCRWNFFWDTNFGAYNNYIDAYQRVYGQGDVRFTGSQQAATVWANKNDVAFMGEMRLGGAYDFTCNWRGVLAYRAIGVSGVALSSDQIANDFANYSQTALIDSSGGLLIHGVQAGVECRY